jgi:CubicO group peptidase (beta-lactamase class C family)
MGKRKDAICALPISASVADQDAIFADAFSGLEQAIGARAFPGASVAVTCAGKLVALKAFGHFTYDADSPPVATDTIFDLASVTKVIATTTMAMVLHERGLLDLQMPVVGILPEFVSQDDRRRQVTIRMLLAHSSGLPAYEKLFLRTRTREAMLEETFKVPLRYDPGAHAEYSDIGFILLGIALERLVAEKLDAFCQREVFGPLVMARTAFNPPAVQRRHIPPTANDVSFRQRIIQGEVQDENASVLGGVAGHAGLFSDATDLAIFALAMLNGGPPILRADTLAAFSERQTVPPGTSRALGWDTPSAPSQSGKYFSPLSFGHLGYTGTSLWIDPERQVSVALLTNRTWPDCSNPAIKTVRPRLHDAVLESLAKFPNPGKTK